MLNNEANCIYPVNYLSWYFSGNNVKGLTVRYRGDICTLSVLLSQSSSNNCLSTYFYRTLPAPVDISLCYLLLLSNSDHL